jgi:phospholipase C
LYGPNGFFREFGGNAKDPEIEVTCEYETGALNKNQLTGNVVLNITNLGKKDYNIEVTDNAYKGKAVSKKISASGKERIVLDLTKSFGWYDFSIRVSNNNAYIKRYAGKVETGKETHTDPYMGRSFK